MAELTTIFNAVYTAAATLLRIGGSAADNAAKAGNPVQVGGIYSTAPATRDNGDAVAWEMSATGAGHVEVKGRKIALPASASYDQVLNVAASGTVTITITPSAGELWRVRMLTIIVPAPSGAASGTHTIQIRQGTNSNDFVTAMLRAAYNASIQVWGNVFTAANLETPTDEAGQVAVIQNIVASNACPLYIYYGNDTNVTQTGTMTLKLLKEVEYIVA